MSGSMAPAGDVTSSGLVAGDDPLHYALLLLIVQVVIIIVLSRFITLLFRPLRQPRVVAEIIGGVLLGPSAFGRIPGFTATIFPESSLTVLKTFANIGLIFFLFLVGLELDLRSLRKTGKAAAWMAAVGIVLPFGLGVGVSLIIYNVMKSDLHTSFGPFTVFLGVALSITAFPVLARILAERKLLTTELGQMAMSAAAVNDIVAWILLALAVAITNAGSSPLVALWVLLSGVAFLLFMFLIVRPFTFALAHYEEPIPESVVAATLVIVLGAAFLTDLIGINVIFGAFISGLIIPKDGPFAGMLIEKVEDYVSILFLPLYFASSGLNTQLSYINNAVAVGILVLVFATSCIGKVLGTVIVAKISGVDLRKSFALGFLMNTKGLVELIVLNIGLSKGVINEEIFAIMVVVALVSTFMTTPLVMWLHKPARDEPPYRRRKFDVGRESDELRTLICAHGPRNLPALIHLTEMLRGQFRKSLRVFVLHLMEFSERSSAIRIASMARKEGRPHWHEGESELDSVEVTFQTYGQLSKVKVNTTIAISAFNNMHEDICSTAAMTRANFILLPFHKYYRLDGSPEVSYTHFQHVNSMTLQQSPCSVGILVDRGLGGPSVLPMNLSQHICVLFFGGPDDREALKLARRMSQHSGVKLTVIQCLIKQEPNPQGLSDNAQLGKFSRKQFGNVSYSFFQHSWSGLLRSGRKIWKFCKAPYRKVKPVNASTSPPSQQDSETEYLGPDSTRNGSTPDDNGTINLKMDKVEYENEKKLDMRALAPFAVQSKKETTSLAKNKIAIDAAKNKEDLEHVDLDFSTDENMEPLTRLKLWEMKDPLRSLIEIPWYQDYGLVIVGLHSNKVSPILQSGTTIKPGGHGVLGPIGNLLVSKDLRRSMQASVLVVQQHHPSQGQFGFSVVPDEEPHDAPPHLDEEQETESSLSDSNGITMENLDSINEDSKH